MEIIKVGAKVRTESGKSAARRVRREGQIPAVAYGKELPATSLEVSPKQVAEILKSSHGKNTVVELGIDGGKKLTVMLRDYDVHPVSREVLHADFVEVRLDQPADVEVPLVLKGKAAGVVLGGVLRQVYRRLPVRCLPEKIPVSVEHDVTELELGAHVKVSELKLPEGVTVRLPADQTVAGVVAPEKERPEEGAPGAPGAAPGAAAGGPAAAGGAGPAGAGAAGAAAPAAGAAGAGGKEKKK